MKFRKKPVVIEAFRVNDCLICAEKNWRAMPSCIEAAYNEGKILFLPKCIEIKTLEGRMTASTDDWIIQGVSGELYPCKPDIFAKTYEPVE